MYKEYKTIRIARETKYWLNELIDSKERKINEVKKNLIEQEIKLNKLDDYAKGYSATISIAVTSGSILEAAYNYAQKQKGIINWKDTIDQLENEKRLFDKKFSNLDVGTLTPRFYLYSYVLNGLEEYRRELKPPEMQRILMLSYVVKLIIFVYYKAVILDKEDV